MYVCTLRRYYDQVYFRFRHLEFEPSGSAVAPNPYKSVELVANCLTNLYSKPSSKLVQGGCSHNIKRCKTEAQIIWCSKLFIQNLSDNSGFLIS